MRIMDLRLRPHEEHLKQAARGWDLIYEMHEQIAVIKTEIKAVHTLLEHHGVTDSR